MAASKVSTAALAAEQWQPARELALRSGGRMPAFGLGTWKSKAGEAAAAVEAALAAGYRHIDCAHVYGNEHEIGLELHAHLPMTVAVPIPPPLLLPFVSRLAWR
eukprot:TRINITY_DN6085_c0_g1_i2.p6 TRINITY_DN6085_c0_g1~~TRINITY_DN6085_c0_g1_i2.p6  ORF type:complete len:104 (-),score=17.69 TRINITY_DN6085_c0_g1_i2:848-1159(-)